MHFLITALAYIVTILVQIEYVCPKKQPLLGYNIVEMPPPNKYESPGVMRFPETFFHNARYRQPTPLKGIQYAPLHASINVINMHNNKNESTTLMSTTLNINNMSQKSFYEKKHLEPRAKHEDNNKQLKDCLLALKSEVFTGVSRSPGHNAVYRTFQQLPRDKSFKGNKPSKKRNKPMAPPKKALKKINYLKPYGIYRPIDITDTTKKWPMDLTNKINPEVAHTKSKLVFNEDEISEDIDSVFSVTKHQLAEPFNKYFTNRLHLNIARVYSMGKQQKVPPYADPQALTFVAPRKTQLFPPKTFRLTVFKTL